MCNMSGTSFARKWEFWQIFCSAPQKYLRNILFIRHKIFFIYIWYSQTYSQTVNRKQVGRNKIIQDSAHESFYSRILPSTSRHFSQNQGLCSSDLLLQTASCTRLHKTHGRLPFPQSAIVMIFTQFCASVCVCVCVCVCVRVCPCFVFEI